MPQSCRSVDQFGFGSWRSWSDRVNAVANGLDRVSCDYGGLLLPVHQDDPRSVPRVAASCAALEGWGRRFISLSTSVQSARAPRTIISVTSTDMTGSLCFRYRIEMSGLVQGQDVSGSGLRPFLADCPPSDTRWRRFCLRRSQLPSGGNGAGTPLCTGVPGGVFPWGARYSWPVTHIQGLASFALSENTPKGCDQPIKFDRLAVELVAPRGERPFALAGERMSGESDNGDVAGLRIAPQSPCGFPAVDNRHFEVHQDDVRPLGSRHLAALLAVLCRQHLEIAEQLEPHLEHVDVVVVVFDVKHFGHDAGSVLTAVRVWASRRMRSTRSAG